MDNVSIPWLKGEGNIVVEFNGSGSVATSVKSDTANQGLDRSQEITYKTIAGTPQDTVIQAVNQAGRREVFNAADGEFILADGGTFNVIKGA